VFIIPGNYTFIEGLGRRRRAKASQPGVGLPSDTLAEHTAPVAVAEKHVVHAGTAPLPAKAGGEHL